MIRVALSGPLGRLGSEIRQRLIHEPSVELAEWIVRNIDEARISSVVKPDKILSDAKNSSADVFVETATRQAAMTHLDEISSQGRKIPILLATTGLTESDHQQVKKISKTSPIVWAPNLSIGLALLRRFVEITARTLPAFDAEVLEIHHRKKKDAPSGTALSLAAAIAEGRKLSLEQNMMVARSGEIGARSDTEIGVQSLRGGTVVGDHTVFFLGNGERIELSHKAENRGIFAEGALKAIQFLSSKHLSAGLYSMDDVLFQKN